MAQDNILLWLALKYSKGNRGYFSVDTIKKEVGGGRSVWRNLAKLNNWGFLDLKIVYKPRYKRYFKIKPIHVKQVLVDFKSTEKSVLKKNYTDNNIIEEEIRC